MDCQTVGPGGDAVSSLRLLCCHGLAAAADGGNAPAAGVADAYPQAHKLSDRTDSGFSGAQPQLTVASLLWPALLTPARKPAFFYGDAAARLADSAAAAPPRFASEGRQLPRQMPLQPAAAMAAAVAAPTAAVLDPERPWLAMDAAGRQKWAAEKVDAAVARLCGRAVGPEEPLMGAGLDSLTAVELRTELAGLSKLDLPPMLAFDYPTPAALAGCIADLMAPVAAAAQEASAAAAAQPAAQPAAAATLQPAAAGLQQMQTMGANGDAAAAATGPPWLRLDHPQRRAHVTGQVSHFASPVRNAQQKALWMPTYLLCNKGLKFTRKWLCTRLSRLH